MRDRTGLFGLVVITIMALAVLVGLLTLQTVLDRTLGWSEFMTTTRHDTIGGPWHSARPIP